MHVAVIHRISDPEGFQQAEQQAMVAGLPEGFGLPVDGHLHLGRPVCRCRP